MSEYGEGDYCSVWQDRWQVARKEHECAACDEIIRPGHRYHITFYVYEGVAHSVKRCARCQTIFEHLIDRIEKEGDEEEYCNLELNCGHNYRERWEEDPPEWLAALAFWLPGDPLPEMPEKSP